MHSSLTTGHHVFAHGVASGDPTTQAVVIWTRVEPLDEPDLLAGCTVGWTMARDPELREVVASGATCTSATRDWTVHVDVEGLHPGHTYYYAFDVDGVRSPVGRTRTLPAVDAEQFRFAFVSCAKFNAGYFNVYARLAEREDLDFVLHLGDYIYEASNTPPKNQTPGADIGRPFEPLHECRTLADYRMRYAQYRRDPDVQALHASHPVIATLDDHELADGAWRGGADNHDEDRDGPWAVRRSAALQARWEWLPARQPDPTDPSRVHRSVRVGDLAELYLIDFRSRRDRPQRGSEMFDSRRTALGAEQKAWLLDGIATCDARWRLIGNPSPFAQTWRPGLSPELHRSMRALKFMHATDDAVDEDQWEGYPVERDEILAAIESAGPGRSIVLAGDLHVSLAYELAGTNGPIVAEVVTPSITSQNLDEKLHLEPRTDALQVERDFVDALPGLQWCELESHGYVVTDVDRERIVLQWWYVDTVLEHSTSEVLGNEMVMVHGDPRLREVVGASPTRTR